MIVILYRWRVEAAKEGEFIESWTTITKYYLENCESLGSRLHRGSDGVFYAYAQWPDLETHERAVLDVRMELARLHMQDAITEAFPKVHFEIVADNLVPSSAPANDESR